MKIGIIGGGNMGLAIASRVAKDHTVFIAERDKQRAGILKKKYRVAVCDLGMLLSVTQVIIVAVKPQDIEPVLAQMKEFLHKGQVVISIAAGITTEFLEKRLGPRVKIIRAMPNMPAQIGAGITAVAKGKFASSQDVRVAVQIFNAVGQSVVVKENLMDAVTAVSGSGPAYVFLFSECLNIAAQKLGLNKALAQQLVLATLQGSVQQLISSQEDAASLRAKVTSKGGTTQAAIVVMEQRRIQEIFTQALKAAKKRAGELAKR